MPDLRVEVDTLNDKAAILYGRVSQNDILKWAYACHLLTP